MAWNFPLVLRIPYVGPWISASWHGQDLPGPAAVAERFYFLGLIIFVGIADGSGSIVGSIVRRMLGMILNESSPASLSAGLSGVLPSRSASIISRIIPAEAGPWVSFAVFLVIGTALLVMYRSYSRIRETDA